MKNTLLKTKVLLSSIVVLTTQASAQFGWEVCFDPTNTEPISTDYLSLAIGTNIIEVMLGLNGTVTWGPQSPCGVPPGNDAEDATGYLGIRTGAIGSDVTNLDDLSIHTMGTLGLGLFPVGAGNDWSFVTIRAVDSTGNATDTKWGEGGLDVAYTNASFTKFTAWQTVDGGVRAELRCETRANAIRFEWTLINQNAETTNIGLAQKMWLGMLNFSQSPASSGWANNAYVLLPTGRPIVIEKEWIRQQDPINFPKKAEIFFRQAFPYPGLRVLLDKDTGHLDQTQVDRFQIGTWDHILGTDGGFLWDSTIFDDFSLDSTAFAIFFDPKPVVPGGSRKIVYYFELPWHGININITQNGGYALSTESQYLVATDTTGLNDLNPNPFTIVAWVDNLFDRVDKDVDMSNISLTIQLPPGLSLDAGETATKIIPTLQHGTVDNVSWQVVADGATPGVLKYTISCSATPGGQKQVEGQVVIGITPKTNLKFPYNLVTVPFSLANNSFSATYAPASVIAYNWNPLLQQYEVTNIIERGRGQWVLPDSEYTGLVLNGATPFGDDPVGGFSYVLRRGWNLIGNPYLYPIQLNQLNAISSTNQQEVLTWKELVQKGFVSGTIYYFDPDPLTGNFYKFSSDTSQLVPAGQGFWVKAKSTALITLYWPPIYLPGLPGGLGLAAGTGDDSPIVDATEDWSQTQLEWRLGIQARGQNLKLGKRYFGVAPTEGDANERSILEPPASPGTKVLFSFMREDEGKLVPWIQDIRKVQSKQTYKIRFTSYSSGVFTLSWPEVNEIPKTIRLKFVDTQTGKQADMRVSKSYAFVMTQPGTREFLINVQQ